MVLTDNEPLLALFQKEPMDALMARWMLKIQAFTPIVKHLPGKQNLLADLLSRRNTMEELEENVEEEVRVEGVHAILARDPSTHLWVNAREEVDTRRDTRSNKRFLLF